jgi:hypothetical protein
LPYPGAIQLSDGFSADLRRKLLFIASENRVDLIDVAGSEPLSLLTLAIPLTIEDPTRTGLLVTLLPLAQNVHLHFSFWDFYLIFGLVSQFVYRRGVQ